MRHEAEEQPGKRWEVVTTECGLGDGEMIGEFVIERRRNRCPEPSDGPHAADSETAEEGRVGRCTEVQRAARPGEMQGSPSKCSSDHQPAEPIKAQKSEDSGRTPEQGDARAKTDNEREHRPI